MAPGSQFSHFQFVSVSHFQCCQQPTCCLTFSLPLPLQVFQFLIAPADCSDPSELFQSLREVASSQQGAAAASCPQTDGTNQQPAAPGDVTKSLQSSTQPGGSGSQSAASCSGQSGGTAVVYPPLNPFLVPAELLMKKQCGSSLSLFLFYLFFQFSTMHHFFSQQTHDHQVIF